MKFECVKTENCFAGSQTYEYRLPITGEEFSRLLSGWEVRVNARLRRPVFLADRNGVNVKGLLAHNVIKASFPEDRWEEEKAAFEEWLGGMDV
ncbi:MAG: hypothetical protein ACOYIR_07450 [Christensenellales bacterium]|jgi:hypothetical protein